VALVSNLLDNAICAAAQAYPPEVYVRVRKTGEEYLLSVRNRVQKDLELVDGELPRSTKAEPGHGMGLVNVREVLDRCRCEYTLSCRDRWFRFTCAVPTRKL
jgi:two-component system sensor histidine kinase AgrC